MINFQNQIKKSFSSSWGVCDTDVFVCCVIVYTYVYTVRLVSYEIYLKRGFGGSTIIFQKVLGQDQRKFNLNLSVGSNRQ